MPSKLNDQWQTPLGVLDVVRLVMPTINLDPATSLDNPTGALNFCTGLMGDCGLEKDWTGHHNIWLNHPYSQTSGWLFKVYQTLLNDPSIRVINLAPMSILSNVGTRGLLLPSYCVPLGRVKFEPPQSLRAQREAAGKVADPGSPRSDVGLFMYRFSAADAELLSDRFRSLVIHVHP